MTPRELLSSLFRAAVDAADPAIVLPPHLAALPAPPPGGRVVVVGAGKASARMAQVLEATWPHDPALLSGVVVTRYGHGVPCRHIAIVEAAHPVPDAAGEAAARRILEAVRGLSEHDRVIALISGGGSALLALPAPGVTLADKQAVSRALLASGAPIGAMNCVRKHLSAVKGGRLAAAAWPAPILTLAISDVPGDDPAVIASGPTVADPGTREEALAILARHDVHVPDAVRAWLVDPASETPKPGDARLARAETRIVASALASLEAAARLARERGITPLILGDMIEGEALEAARVLAGVAASCAVHGLPVPPPCVLLSGGETTVTLPSGTQGRGGRNSEFLLGLALALQARPGIHAIACDTDGIDGSEDNAGAILGDDTLARARARGIDARAKLTAHDAWGFFHSLDDLVVTGPTLTNVNDFRAILVLPPDLPPPV